ncbi:unnamed protein product [Meganyctiphanes norvegica]|uniref:Uncharacterized protein n=1 Tax=Meganyctiphanes norvegica TaxID=48144 RepID=A0AAV2Q457_MEGNR
MTMRLLVAVVCVAVAVVSARDPQDRLVETKALPNNIMDTVVNGLVYHFLRTGQGITRAMPEKTAQIPFNAGTEQKQITIKMAGELKNFQQIRRAGTARLDADNNVLTGKISIDNAEVAMTYTSSFPAAGVAPANSASGQTSMKGQVFCDLTMLVDQDGKPITITSAKGRVGWHKYGGATGLNGNQYGPTYEAAFQDSLRILLKDMCEKTAFLIAQNQVLPKLGVE